MLGPFFCPIDPLTVASSAVQNSPFFSGFCTYMASFWYFTSWAYIQGFFSYFPQHLLSGFSSVGGGGQGAWGRPTLEDFPGLPPPLPPIKNGNAPYPPAEESLRFLRVFWQKSVRPPTMGGAPPHPWRCMGAPPPWKSSKGKPCIIFWPEFASWKLHFEHFMLFSWFPWWLEVIVFFLANFFLKGNISGCFFQFLEIFISWTFWGRKWPNFIILCALFFTQNELICKKKSRLEQFL